MNLRALRQVAQVDFCRNLTAFLGFFARETVLRAGAFVDFPFNSDFANFSIFNPFPRKDFRANESLFENRR
jgi:hypothetical protein